MEMNWSILLPVAQVQVTKLLERVKFKLFLIQLNQVEGEFHNIIIYQQTSFLHYQVLMYLMEMPPITTMTIYVVMGEAAPLTNHQMKYQTIMDYKRVVLAHQVT